jgi:rhodanese-related sulfurtransferase
MRRFIGGLVALIMSQAAAVLFAAAVTAAGVSMITAQDLKAKLGNSDITILDVRREAHWNASDRKIVGAVRENPDAIASWAGRYAKEKTLVLYCA